MPLPRGDTVLHPEAQYHYVVDNREEEDLEVHGAMGGTCPRLPVYCKW